MNKAQQIMNWIIWGNDANVPPQDKVEPIQETDEERQRQQPFVEDTVLDFNFN